MEVCLWQFLLVLSHFTWLFSVWLPLSLNQHLPPVPQLLHNRQSCSFLSWGSQWFSCSWGLWVVTHWIYSIPRGYLVGKVRPEMTLSVTQITSAFLWWFTDVIIPSVFLELPIFPPFFAIWTGLILSLLYSCRPCLHHNRQLDDSQIYCWKVRLALVRIYSGPNRSFILVELLDIFILGLF